MSEPKSEDNSVSDIPSAESVTPSVEIETTESTGSQTTLAPREVRKTSIPEGFPKADAPQPMATEGKKNLHSGGVPKGSKARSEDNSMSDIPSAESDAPSIKAETTESTGSQTIFSLLGKKNLRTIVAIVAGILVAGGFLLVANANKSGDPSQIQGKVALSQSELRDLVVAKKLTVYWAGPMAGAKYTLTANTPGAAYVKYLPGGVGLNDTKTLFRVVGTYTQKNAFKVFQDSRVVPGNLGFINADGNGVFYSSSRPSNVYIGIKGKDIQVEVFDPVVGQSLGLVLIRNQIRQIS